MRTPAGPLLAAAALVLAGAAVTAGPKQILPRQIVLARYVCLGFDTGTGFMSEQESILHPENVYPEDRRALEAIHQELGRWKRYVVVPQAHDAELLIAVRWGRRGGVSGGVGTGVGGRRGGSGWPIGGVGAVEMSSPYDTLTVYDSRGGRSGAQLWRVQRRGALQGDPPAAFAELRAQVDQAEAAAPAPPAPAPQPER